MQGVIRANRSCFVSSVGVTVSTLESHASNPKFKSCWNLKICYNFFFFFCLVFFFFFFFLIQLLKHQNNQKCATFLLPLCQHQQQQSSFSTNIAVATAGILLCIFLDTRSADLCFTDKRYFLFSFLFVCVCVCETSSSSFHVQSWEKKTNIGFVTTKTSSRTATDLCYTDVTVFVLTSTSNAWNRFSQKEKKDRCWFYYKFLQQQICAPQTDVAGFVLSSSSNSWFLFSHEKIKKRQVLVLLQVPAVLPVCDQVCPDITVMVNWAIKKSFSISLWWGLPWYNHHGWLGFKKNHFLFLHDQVCPGG